jgi:hypothetical protein
MEKRQILHPVSNVFELCGDDRASLMIFFNEKAVF